ncbi:predicted protein [Botrytis cinerea T4]|uniref:Uncharacterized protein n=1 Tax=Botryotinia fuckeliana (strain T4) TaxID=999810 RepID=G2YQ07_BOTF4|nr:predicted protein [Botrytis cinerea T4]
MLMDSSYPTPIFCPPRRWLSLFDARDPEELGLLLILRGRLDELLGRLDETGVATPREVALVF